MWDNFIIPASRFPGSTGIRRHYGLFYGHYTKTWGQTPPLWGETPPSLHFSRATSRFLQLIAFQAVLSWRKSCRETGDARERLCDSDVSGDALIHLGDDGRKQKKRGRFTSRMTCRVWRKVRVGRYRSSGNAVTTTEGCGSDEVAGQPSERSQNAGRALPVEF